MYNRIRTAGTVSLMAPCITLRNNDLLLAAPCVQEKSFMFEERLAAADKLKQLGNERFKRGQMQQAAEAYER